MAEKRQFSVPVVGGRSLLVIFAVLCLTVFALLSLSTVQAYGRLSDAAAKAVTDYYEADCRAEEIFACLRSGEIPAGVVQTGNRYSYVCPVSDLQELQVELLRQEDGWRVVRWQAVSVETAGAEQIIPVWDGGEPVSKEEHP